jgi:DNA-binding PadR family transcriptional regulator
VVREFFLGFIKIHILHHAGEEPVYGLALIAELRRHGYELSPGTLYPVLHQLEREGYLRRLNRVVNGKMRKYYTLTSRGGQAVSDARAKIAELVGEVLEAHPAVHDVKARKSPTRARRIRSESRTRKGYERDDTSSREGTEDTQVPSHACERRAEDRAQGAGDRGRLTRGGGRTL